jgi:hypothetical protein
MEPNYGYKHTRGFIVFLIIIFCGWVIVAHSQVSNTGNLVGSTWSNGYSVPELTCWQVGDPNCSPGGIPYVRPDGSINFSYAATELYQARNLADVLPYSGTGLMVTGFQYNWRSKNGNGWDDGRLDVLQAYVQMYSKSGQWIESQTYSLNFLHNWTDFAWSGTFSKERRGSDLGTVIYGFYGKDNNYWMGPYGPEITNVSFSLRYQPDPCVVNPLHSTECPGFMSAINRPIPGIQSETTTSTASTSSTSLTTSSSSTALGTAMSVIKLNAQREQGIVDAAVELATSMIATESRQSTTVSFAGIALTQPQQRSTTSTTESGSAGQEQDSIVSSISTFNAALTTQTMTSMSQRTNNRTMDSAQNNQEQEVLVTTLANSGSSLSLPIQTSVAQRTNNRTTDSGQTSQDQDTSTSSMSYNTVPVLAQVQPSTGQRVTNTAANSSQTTTDTESVSVSSTVSAMPTVTPNQFGQSQRTNTKMVDTTGQQDQDQFATPPAQATMASTAPAAPITVARTVTRNQDSQTNSIEQEQTQTVSVTSTTAIVPVQVPTIQKVIQRSDTQTKTDVANDTTNIVDQFIAQNTAVSQTTVSTTAVSQLSPARTVDSSMSLDTESNNQVQIAMIKMPEIAVAVQTDQVNTGILERPPTELQLPVPSIATVTTVSSPVIAEVAPVSEPIRPPQTETPAVDTPTNTIANALIDRTNPLNDMLNGQQQMAQSGSVFAGPAVKSNTADNDLAGGVSISQIARVPAGFDVYQNLAIREIAFYQPREIYRGQRTVDNVRALRSLGQDAKHQEMVDQQYRR